MINSKDWSSPSLAVVVAVVVVVVVVRLEFEQSRTGLSCTKLIYKTVAKGLIYKCRTIDDAITM